MEYIEMNGEFHQGWKNGWMPKRIRVERGRFLREAVPLVVAHLLDQVEKAEHEIERLRRELATAEAALKLDESGFVLPIGLFAVKEVQGSSEKKDGEA